MGRPVKTISASEANRRFSELLRKVAAGERYTVVSRGRPVATIHPVVSGESERQEARKRLVQRLKREQATGSRGWQRDELYER
jgi:prevent-host-death family protein